MPKKAKEQSALWVKNHARLPGMHAVGGVAGLLLHVRGGAAAWVLRVMIGGRRREMGLGGFPSVTLTEARDKARACRSKIDQGIDPIAQRRAARAALVSAITFDEAAKRLVASKAPGFKNAKHLAQWSSTLTTYASPLIGDLPVDQVDVHHIETILSPIWQTKTETAKRVQGRIEAVLDWATVSKHRSGENPARWKGNLDKLFPAPAKVKAKSHHPALPFNSVPGFMMQLRTRASVTDRALEFLILTAARSQEVRGARWPEIDLDAGTWTVPAGRMKASVEHVVPLSKRAIALLRGLPRFAGEHVFPAPRGGELSDMTLSKVIKLMHASDTRGGGSGFMDPKEGRLAVPHGFRSSFRDWASERTAYPRDVVEMALAHTIGNKVEAAYRRGNLLAKRALLMEEWSAFVERAGGDSKVVALQRRASA
ncbi:Integrase [Luteibacter sp. UNCMF331Sha3.1]|uniref:tyrosine-type recombinase/integrase n=1 Tax=Luteibacter sp. UNCMF331Sha3.1 TaxID=1502760 RepID=UPI0008D878E2|nr:site-specific integrase [Luteibacter sp. UNCMF331Sha3.1]SEN10181.1 Integrase [Luteibacter sp. UNCMF331Sha3.1]